MRQVARHFDSLVAAGAADMGDALAFRARERPLAPALVSLDRGEAPLPPVTYGALHARARVVAAGLRARLAPGARVLLAFPAGAAFVEALFGCFYAGVIAVPAPPVRGARAGARAAAMARDCDAALLLGEEGDGDAGVPRLCLDALIAGGVEDGVDAPRAPGDVALLQYTSGSTGAPKGVAITHRAIWCNQAVISTSFDHVEGVTLVGWLPNFHDMGLIGNLLQPIYAGGVSVMMAPTAFMQRPLRWLRAISEWRAHTSGAPNFAYDLCVRAATAENTAGLDLSCWRVAFNGAEPIRPATIEAFAQRFAAHGFQRKAMMACYGLAESTLMVAGAPVDAPPVVVHAGRDQLAAGVLAPPAPGEAARALVSCGDSVAGARIVIADRVTGAPLADGAVGEVCVRSPSVCAGYWNRADASAALWRTIEGEAFLCTGDLGARTSQGLFIVGRMKDVIILQGRNVHPADIEAAVETALAPVGVLRAVAARAELPGGEGVALFAELAREALRGLAAESSWERLAQRLRAAAMDAAEAPLAGVVLLKPGAAPLTSSGKPRRGRCLAAFQAGTLPGVVWRDAGAVRLIAGAEAAGAAAPAADA
ncbi:MAG: fatty acyl-AMP ligase [Hyphomonadaceae bacterium]|nr:fatty acyl-AMP ligase [Hyphomonadaceae bacterium]